MMRYLVKTLFRTATGYTTAGKKQPLPVSLTPTQTNWLIQSGLLPGTCYYKLIIAEDAETTNAVESAQLTYRLLGTNTLTVYRDIISNAAFCPSLFVPLKGIDLCQRYYPQPYLRPMRDIDFLVEPGDVPAVLSQLAVMGFVNKSTVTSHHEIPLYNPARQCWVEVHTGLFPAASPLGKTGVFNTTRLAAVIRPADMTGQNSHTVLTPDFMLVYLAAHWADDMNFESGALPLLDMALVIRKEAIDWEALPQVANHPLVAGYLLIALSTLASLLPELIPGNILSRLKSRAIYLNTPNRMLCHMLINRYMLGGKELTVLTRHTIPLFASHLLAADRRPWTNLAAALFSLVAPHHGKLGFWASLRLRLRSLVQSRRG